MSLSVTEQIKIIQMANTPKSSGGISPAGLDGDLKLIDYLKQRAIVFGSLWLEGFKEFPIEDQNGDPINQEADAYRQKMISICQRSFRMRGDDLVQLLHLFVAVLGEAPYDYQNVVDANDAAWNSVSGEMMQETFEKFSGVLKAEAAAYDAIS